MTGLDNQERGHFHDLLDKAISGQLDRRQVMARGAALGLSAARNAPPQETHYGIFRM